MNVRLKDLIKMMIQDDGGEILDRDDDFIWARIDGILWVYDIAKNQVEDDDVVKFARNTEQVKGTKVIFCLNGYSKLAENIAKKLDIILVPREKLAYHIGEFILKLEERGESIPLIGEEDVEVELVEYEEEEEEEENPDIIPIIIEDVGSGGEEKIIKPTVSMDEAIKITLPVIRGFTAQMKLIPYYIFEFSLKTVFEGTHMEKMVNGLIAFNALSGRHEIWKEGFETISKIDTPHIKLEPKVSLDEVMNVVKRALMEEYTKEEEFTMEDENVTIIEKRKTHPLENSIKTNFLGLHYLPVWEVEGREGIAYVNASTGKIMKNLR